MEASSKRLASPEVGPTVVLKNKKATVIGVRDQGQRWWERSWTWRTHLPTYIANESQKVLSGKVISNSPREQEVEQ